MALNIAATAQGHFEGWGGGGGERAKGWGGGGILGFNIKSAALGRTLREEGRREEKGGKREGEGRERGM